MSVEKAKHVMYIYQIKSQSYACMYMVKIFLMCTLIFYQLIKHRKLLMLIKFEHVKSNVRTMFISKIVLVKIRRQIEGE